MAEIISLFFMRILGTAQQLHFAYIRVSVLWQLFFQIIVGSVNSVPCHARALAPSGITEVMSRLITGPMLQQRHKSALLMLFGTI
jgi:hypothetical protein